MSVVIGLDVSLCCVCAAWTCHEGGAACVAWAGSLGALVSCGRRGDVLVWDLRARAVRHRLHAHHAPIKCVALSPREDYYAIGAADGDIKVRITGLYLYYVHS